MTSSAVHREGVAAFASLPGDSFAYTIDYADADGHVWLKSAATDREWECVIANREVFTANPAFREQFDMELELLQLALQQDPRVKKTVACKHVVLTKAENGDSDDLVMQLNQKVYARLNPELGAMVQFPLKYVPGSGNPPSTQDGKVTDKSVKKPTTRATKPKVKPETTTTTATRTEKPKKDLLPRLREENKALKATNRALTVDLKRARAEITALRKENQAVSATKAGYETELALLGKERVESLRAWKSENDALRRENKQFQQQHTQLIKMGGMHEFQRQHIEHLRRKIQALEGKGGQPGDRLQQQKGQEVPESLQEVAVTSSESSGTQGDEEPQQETQGQVVVADAVGQSKRRRLSGK
ncbi:hypothetical protein Gpo141_00011543 [Globisporangium polare]